MRQPRVFGVALKCGFWAVPMTVQAIEQVLVIVIGLPERRFLGRSLEILDVSFYLLR